ncbi:hypothetical protein [Caldimonas tepidiphila]|uniref:hypothetical protein n=1 Tax=Caldimonas tepidiphila TaxID=2315841 RepID=UPI000E5C1D0E|nr:hypothetical protein [Caldimonas tepidiphila]
MSLPSDWVDALFARLSVRYGRDFLSRWEGLDLALVKADWAEELAGFAGRPEAIKHGLEHLPPGKPPTVGEFAALCRNAPVPQSPALPAPPADPERVKTVMQRLTAAGSASVRSERAWARRLEALDQSGEPLTITQRTMYREALGYAAQPEHRAGR